jgi:uncharacterized OsmC-like protein
MYKALIENKGDSRYYATTRDSSFVLDTEGKGANPVDTLLASLCGCLGHYVREYMTDNQILHNGFSVEAEAGVTQDNSSLARINVCIDLKELDITDRQESEILKYVERCKINNILNKNPGVSISFKRGR